MVDVSLGCTETCKSDWGDVVLKGRIIYVEPGHVEITKIGPSRYTSKEAVLRAPGKRVVLVEDQVLKKTLNETSPGNYTGRSFGQPERSYGTEELRSEGTKVRAPFQLPKAKPFIDGLHMKKVSINLCEKPVQSDNRHFNLNRSDTSAPHYRCITKRAYLAITAVNAPWSKGNSLISDWGTLHDNAVVFANLNIHAPCDDIWSGEIGPYNYCFNSSLHQNTKRTKPVVWD